MANKETRIYKTDTLESLRQKSNEISLHLGDNEQLNALMADKTYVYSAGAGDTLFAGPDTSSPAKTARFEVSPAHTVDNTGGYIVLEGVSSIASAYIAGAVIYQGSSSSPSWSGYIVSSSTSKILVRDSSGTFTTSANLTVGTSTPLSIPHANIVRIVTESYPIGIVRVYKNNSELTQDMTANGFHVANIRATITQTGSPTLTNYTEGVTIYQGASETTQSAVESNASWYGTLHSVSDGVIRVKTYNGTFSASTLIRALGSSDTITGTNHGALVPVDSTYGSYVELNTPAASGNAIKVFSLDVVAAINELQDDIGTVESLTTAANDLVLAINEHDAELGTITAAAMGTSASTVSTAIREHEDQIGNVDITDIDASNDTITGALEQLHDEVGDVTASNLGTSASNLTAAVREHEDQIGNENITSIDSASNTITGALNQLHTEVGDLALHTNSSDLTEAINELEEDLFNGEGATKRTRSDLLTTDTSSIVDSINELHSELFVDGTGVSFTGLSADFFKEAIEELRTELGNHAVLDTNVTTDAVSAINELENVLRDDTTQRTGYVMGTNANNIIAAINEIETVLRGANANYTLTTAAQNVRDAINEHESQIGNMVFGTEGPVDAADSTDLSGAIRVLDAEIGDTSYTGADLTTAIKNTQDDILVNGSLTTLNTTNTSIQGAINEIEADLFNAGNAGSGGSRREMSDLKTADKTSIVDSINEIYDDIHTSGSVTLDTTASHLVGAINEIEGVFDASAYEISAGSNAFNITSDDFTINSDGTIKLDTEDGIINLFDDTVQYGSLTNSGGDLVIKSGTSTMLTGSGTNATFNNNLTIENNLTVDVNTSIAGTLGVTGHTSLSTLGVSGDVGVGGNLSVTGTTELDSTLGVDGNFRVGVNKFNVTAASGNTQIDGTLEVDGTTGIDGNFRVGAAGASKFDVVAATGNTQIDGTLEVDGTGGIDGNFRVGNNKFNVTATSGNTQIDGTLDVDGNFEVGATKFNVTAASGNFVAKGTGTIDGHTDLNSTVTVDGHGEFNSTVNVDGITTISNATESLSAATGALVVTGGVGIGEDLYIAGDLYVEGDSVTLNTETLTVEDTLVLAGNGLTSEPSTGGFGFEVGPITSPSGVASNVTGAHSIVYNYGHDNGDGTYGQWQADGSLILSSATLDTPYVEGASFGPSDDLTFNAGSGLSETVVKTGSTIVTEYVNTDRGSSQNIFKTVTINTTPASNVVADSNSDTLNLRGLDAITLTSVPGTDTISIDHDNFGTAGTYGITGTQNGQYIKSIITNAQGHVTAVTSSNFDTRYQATNPSWQINVNNLKVDDIYPAHAVDFIEGTGIDIAGVLSGSESNITISHQDTSSVANLSQNNSGNTFIQDLAFTFDTFGHVTGATASTATVAIGNGTFSVSGSSGLSGSGSMTANQSGNSSASLTNTDKGSSQNIFKNIAVRNLADTTLGTVVADNNNDTIYLDAGNSGITLSVNAGSDHISINHADTSSQSSVNNGARTYIQDITLDTYGHITAISSATESTYDYEHPEDGGDSISIDTGALTGATVISDLDFNITTNTLGHVTDANGTISTRNLTLTDLEWDGWDLWIEGTKRADINVDGIVNFTDDGFLTTGYLSTNNTISYGHPTSPLNGTYGGNNNGIVIEAVTVDTRGHLTAVATRDLHNFFDKYYDWNVTADNNAAKSVQSNYTLDIEGGTNISTETSGSGSTPKVTINFDDPGFLTTQRSATFDAIQNSGSNSNPFLSMTDAAEHNVELRGGNNVSVTRVNDHRIDIAATNTDVDVTDANLRTRLAGFYTPTANPQPLYIGDSGNNLPLIVRGDLTVMGTQTIMNTETVTTHDNKIELNSNAASTPTEDAGIIINRGSSTNAQIYWSEANDRWYHTYGDGGTAYVIPLPSESMSGFTIHDGDSTQRTIADNKEIKFQEGITNVVASDNNKDYININWTDTNSGSDADPYDLDFAHKLTTRTNISNSAAPGSAGSFAAVTGLGSNATGHVTSVNTTTITLPTSDNYASWTAKDDDGSTYTITSGDTLQFNNGNAGIDIDFSADDVLDITNTMHTNNTAIKDDSRNTLGVTRLYRRDANNDYSVQTNWTGTYWQLEGYNADTYHAPVRVEKSEVADSALSVAYSNVTGTPTIPTVGNGTVTIAPGYGMKVNTSLTASQAFSMNQSNSETITLAVNGTDASTASTVVVRDASGDINARLFRSEYDTTNASIGYIMTQVDTVSNNYIRPSTAAQIRTFLNVADGANNSSADTGTPAILSNGSTPSLNSGISAAEVRSIIGAGTSSSDTTYLAGDGITLSGTTFNLDSDQRGVISYIGTSSNYMYPEGISKIDSAGGFHWDNNTGPDIEIIGVGATASSRISINVDVSGTMTEEFRFGNDGTFHADGDVIAYSSTTASDIKLKENVQKVEGALELVSQLDGVTFDWKDKERGSSAGVIAQNVEEVLPSAVRDVDTLGEEGQTHKAVDYNQLSALFIEAIKELKEENKLLRAEIESLKDINS